MCIWFSDQNSAYRSAAFHWSGLASRSLRMNLDRIKNLILHCSKSPCLNFIQAETDAWKTLGTFWEQDHGNALLPNSYTAWLSNVRSISGNHLRSIHRVKHQEGLLLIQSGCNQQIGELLCCATIIHLVAITTPVSFKSQHHFVLLLSLMAQKKIEEQGKLS